MIYICNNNFFCQVFTFFFTFYVQVYTNIVNTFLVAKMYGVVMGSRITYQSYYSYRLESSKQAL